MKLKIIFAITILFCTISMVANAQDGNNRGGFDIEKIKREKATFLIKELNLSDAEAKAFLPVESEFMQKKIQINRDTRDKTRELRKKESKTDADYKKITEINLDAEAKEASLTKEYYQKFSTILSAEKVEKYRRADQKYMQMLLERRKQKRGE